MSDGNPTPLALDGMGAFHGGRRGLVRLVRNSEDRNAAGQGSVGGTAARSTTRRAGGGTTTLVYDEYSRQLVQDHVSLNGTTVNCAGGIGYRRRSWLTAEETVRGPEATAGFDRFPERHGYLFEVPLRRGPGELEREEPIRAAGRFRTRPRGRPAQRNRLRDRGPGSGRGAGFYRFLPDDPYR